MPLKNGLDTTKELLNMGCKGKIIFISADYTAKNKALKAGACDFIDKPIDLSSLIEIIKKHTRVQNHIT